MCFGLWKSLLAMNGSRPRPLAQNQFSRLPGTVESDLHALTGMDVLRHRVAITYEAGTGEKPAK